MTLTTKRTDPATLRDLAPTPPDVAAPGGDRAHLFVVGAGYVGLVTAVGMARLGHRVTLSDIDEQRIDTLRAGDVPIFEPGLPEALEEVRERITFTTDATPPADARFSFITVSTPLRDDGLMDLTNVLAVVRRLVTTVPADHVVVVRSTLMPDGPDAIAKVREPGEGGPALVTNPEFLREGSALQDFLKPGRIVAGMLAERDRAAAEEVLALYAGIEAPGMIADARSVAMIKIASNVFLAMKVAYANELARLCDAYGANATVVADGLGLDDRIGRSFLDPGPGIGGSCLPEQAVALDVVARTAGVAAPLIGSVAIANDTHRTAIVRRIGSLLGIDMDASPTPLTGTRVAILGLAFKANTDDVRQSAPLAIAAELASTGASVVGTDPRAIANALRSEPGLETAANVDAAVRGADAVLIATEWPEYRSLDWKTLAPTMRGTLVFDTREVADPVVMRDAGLRLVRLGRTEGAA
ncbi:MAG TPA: UDP-glucose/GDP-mannose dehydrogenase family protein [Candidatus Limnocylindrales bacterium]|nr:UDP-glucose/GDP-mannose dehydrogenase family protein [Candidatus Limnocylindrales bacterium]